MLGEADHSFPQLVESLNHGKDITQVAGIVYLKEGHMIVQERTDFVKDLDSLPFPEWDIVGIDKYSKIGMSQMALRGKCNRFAVMVSSRGCPHACDYCAVPVHCGVKNYRRRDLEKVVNEIGWLIERYAIEEIQFLDDNFFVDNRRVKRLCKLLISKFPDTHFSVPAGTDVSNMDYEVLDLLKEAGFYHLELGIETGDINIQASYVDKKIDLQDLSKKIKYMKRIGIETAGIFMIGFPDETREQIQKTVDLATSLDLDWIYFPIVTPLPGSPFYKYCLEEGLLVDDYDVNAPRFTTSYIKNPNISRQELETIRKNVWREYMSKRINIDDYDNVGFVQTSDKK
jgi:radical SAM superfamily enzyme YgiQ (UPF0313 family)